MTNEHKTAAGVLVFIMGGLWHDLESWYSFRFDRVIHPDVGCVNETGPKPFQRLLGKFDDGLRNF